MPSSSQLSLFTTMPQARPAPAPALPARPAVLDLHTQAQHLASELSKTLGLDVRLAVTDNRSTLISFRRRPQALVLRVHRMFLAAPPPVIEALALYAGHGNRRASPVIDRFIREHRQDLRSTTRRRHLRSRGLFHDLQAVYDRLNALHFDHRIDAVIGWARITSRARGHRSIRMGVYLSDDRVIRIHPALDRPEVPDFFVAFVVFHEMLHQAVPSQAGEGRHQHHGPEFRARERDYPDYELAIAWEKAHLEQLLGIRRPKDFELD